MAITTAITSLLTSITELIQSLFNGIYSIFHTIFSAFFGLFFGMFAFVGDLFKGVANTLGGVGSFVASTYSSFFHSFPPLISSYCIPLFPPMMFFPPQKTKQIERSEDRKRKIMRWNANTKTKTGNFFIIALISAAYYGYTRYTRTQSGVTGGQKAASVGRKKVN